MPISSYIVDLFPQMSTRVFPLSCSNGCSHSRRIAAGLEELLHGTRIYRSLSNENLPVALFARLHACVFVCALARLCGCSTCLWTVPAVFLVATGFQARGRGGGGVSVPHSSSCPRHRPAAGCVEAARPSLPPPPSRHVLPPLLRAVASAGGDPVLLRWVAALLRTSAPPCLVALPAAI